MDQNFSTKSIKPQQPKPQPQFTQVMQQIIDSQQVNHVSYQDNPFAIPNVNQFGRIGNPQFSFAEQLQYPLAVVVPNFQQIQMVPTLQNQINFYVAPSQPYQTPQNEIKYNLYEDSDEFDMCAKESEIFKWEPTNLTPIPADPCCPIKNLIGPIALPFTEIIPTGYRKALSKEQRKSKIIAVLRFRKQCFKKNKQAKQVFDPNGLFFKGFNIGVERFAEKQRCMKLGLTLPAIEECEFFDQDVFDGDDNRWQNEMEINNLNYNNWATSQIVVMKTNPMRIKKDALYKPLFRKFRQYFRFLFEKRMGVRGFHNWARGELRQQVWVFMHAIGLPEYLKSIVSLHSMMYLLFPNLVLDIKRANSYYKEIKIHRKIVEGPFLNIFRENSQDSRMQFFTNSLVQWLWNFLYVEMKPMLLVNHFRRVRSYPFEGEARFRALFIDLRYLEITTQATFLPYLTKDTRLIKIFTREEAEKQIQNNKGKYNVRQSDAITKWFSDFKNCIPSNLPLIKPNDLTYRPERPPFLLWDDPILLKTYQEFQAQLQCINEQDERLKEDKAKLGKRERIEEEKVMSRYILHKCRLNRNYMSGLI